MDRRRQLVHNPSGTTTSTSPATRSSLSQAALSWTTKESAVTLGLVSHSRPGLVSPSRGLAHPPLKESTLASRASRVARLRLVTLSESAGVASPRSEGGGLRELLPQPMSSSPDRKS